MTTTATTTAMASICTMYMEPFILPWNFSACKIFAFWPVHDSGHTMSNQIDLYMKRNAYGNFTWKPHKKSRIKINSIWKTSEIYAKCIWNASFIPVLKSKNSRIENDITSVLKLLCVCFAMMRNRNKHNRNIVASSQCLQIGNSNAHRIWSDRAYLQNYLWKFLIIVAQGKISNQFPKLTNIFDASVWLVLGNNVNCK